MDPQKYGFGIHPIFKFGLFILLNLIAFSPSFLKFRWILLPLEIFLGFLVKLNWKELGGFFKVLSLNFLGLFLLFYWAELSFWKAIVIFGNYASTILKLIS